MTSVKAICVWLDSTSDASEPAWIVSEDQLDDRNRAETTRTLSVHADEGEATEAGRKEARRRGLPLYRNPENGPAELVEEAASAD